MASENDTVPEQTEPLEEKLADLNLQEKVEAVAEAEQEYLDGAKEAANISAVEVQKEPGECTKKASEALKEEVEQPPKEAALDEVNIAKEEVQTSPDGGAYMVPTVDHRSIEEPGGEVKKVEVPTAVVHENADPVGKPQQQGKGLIQSVTGKISQSVKSVFSGLTGGKSGKSVEAKIEETPK